jgi:hypothetical protein
MKNFRFRSPRHDKPLTVFRKPRLALPYGPSLGGQYSDVHAVERRSSAAGIVLALPDSASVKKSKTKDLGLIGSRWQQAKPIWEGL